MTPSTTYLAVPLSEQSSGPTVAVIPIKASRSREVRIRSTRVRIISDQHLNPGPVRSKPGLVIFGDIGSSQNMVAVMEVVIVVVGVAKVKSRVAGFIGRTGDHSTPSTCRC